MGAVLTTAAATTGRSWGDVEDLFERFGETDESGQKVFASRNKFVQAVKDEGWAKGDAAARKVIADLLGDYGVDAQEAKNKPDRPVVIEVGAGERNATHYTWRGEREPSS